MCEVCVAFQAGRSCGLATAAPLLGRVAAPAYEIPGNTTSAETIAVGAERLDVLGAPGDEDWFRLSLTAGQSVAIVLTGTGLDPLSDPYLWLYDANGTLVAHDDDGGPGLGSRIEFTAPSAGTWFVAADSYGGMYDGEYRLAVSALVPQTDSIPGDVSTGEALAMGGSRTARLDYQGDRDWFRLSLEAGQAVLLEVQGIGTDALYDPILRVYDAAGRLVRDFDDGPGQDSAHRFHTETAGTFFVEIAGYADSTVGDYRLSAAETDPPRLIDSVRGVTRLDTADPVLVYLAAAGDSYQFDGTTYTATGFNAYEAAQLWSVLEGVEAFAAIDFRPTSDRAAADLEWGSADLGASLLGFFFLPTAAGSGGYGLLNDAFSGWSAAPGGGLDAGGFMYGVAIHELGHGLGLGHTHDTGNGTVVMSGVTAPTETGAFELNQTVYTAMSYNDGWLTNPDGRPGTYHYGYGQTFGAIDVAALQDMYGANATAAGGDDVYLLADANSAGAGYRTIWDTGGRDTLRYAGNRDAVLDLRAATLAYEAGGGGFVSRATGVFAGITIAAGVVIENATGGEGHDRLVGNAAANTLRGGGGDDTLSGGDGADVLEGGTGNDRLTGGGGADIFRFAAAHGDDRILDFRPGTDRVDLLATGAAYHELGISDGAGGALVVYRGGTASAGRIELAGIAAAQLSERDFLTPVGRTLTGTDAPDVLVGTAFADTLSGLGGNDTLSGLAGGDTLDGGAGRDTASYADAPAAVALDLVRGGTAGHAAGDRFVSIEDVLGSPFADTIAGSAGANHLDGGDGADAIRGNGGNDTLLGGGGADMLVDGDGDDRLFGGGGTDRAYGGAGDDWLDVGAGEASGAFQYARGQAGDDTYVVGRDVGRLYLGSAAEDAGSGTADRIVFSDLTLAELTLDTYDYSGTASHAEGRALRFLWGDGGTPDGELRVALEGAHFERFEFADGRSFARVVVASDAGGPTPGTAGNDALFGGAGLDRLYSGAGDDWLDVGAGEASGPFQYARGQAGDDTYVVGRDVGRLYLGSAAEDAGSGTADRIVFSDLTLAELTLDTYDYSGTASHAEGRALRFLWGDGGTPDGELRVALEGAHFERFEFADGRSFTRVVVASDAGGPTLGTAGNDALFGGAGPDRLYSGAGDDWLDVGAGAASGPFQYARGQAGDDTYVVGRDVGRLYLGSAAEDAGSGTADRIVFSDLTLAELTLDTYDYSGTASHAEGRALRFLWDEGGTPDGELRVALEGAHFERFEFADGTVMTQEELAPLFGL